MKPAAYAEEEKVVDRRLKDGQGRAGNMVEENNRVGQIIG